MPTIQQTIQKVREFAELPNGWHFGDGMAPPQPRIDKAILIISRARLLGLERANAFPGVDGQIEVTFYDDGRMLEITIEADNSLTIAEDENDIQVGFSEAVSTPQLYERLNTWASSDLSIGNITIVNVPVQVSRRRLLTFEVANQSRWLTATVPLPRAGRSVLTFFDTTWDKLEIHRFTGPFQTAYFHPIFGPSQLEARLATNVIGTFITGEDTTLAECLEL
jgi:hypothetical protein